MFESPNKSPKGLQDLINQPQHFYEEDPELVKVILNQISILIVTLNEENFTSHSKQIRYILQEYQSETVSTVIVHSYFEKLISFVKLADQKELSLIERLFQIELGVIARDLNNLEVLFAHLDKLFKSKPDIVDFVNRFDCDIVLSFIILIKFHSSNSSESVKAYIQENSSKLLSYIKSKEFPPTYNWTLVLDYILNTPFFPFVHKLLTLSSLKALKSTIEPINKFYQNILKMSFKELVVEIGPESVVPERLLASLLQIKQAEVNQSIAVILGEILIPKSQGLGGALSNANNLPEANAKGSQLKYCFRVIENEQKLVINWYKVFSFLHEFLYDASAHNIQPAIANIIQFLSCLDFKEGLIDIFLSYDWWFSKAFLYILHTMDPQQGYDILPLNNLALCFPEDDNEQTKEQHISMRNILRFISIAKLELTVLMKIQLQQQLPQQQISEQERKLNIYFNQVFEHDYRVYPEYLIAGALTIVDKTPFIVDLIDTLFTLLMDGNLPVLKKVLLKFKEIDVELTINKLIDYYTKRPIPESINKILKFAVEVNLIDELINKLWSLNFKLGLSFLINASEYGYDYKKLIESKISDPQFRGPFCQALLEILEARASQDFEKGQQQALNASNEFYKPLSIPTVYYLLEKLKSTNGLIDADRLKNLQLLLLTTYPRLINFGCGHDEAILENCRESNSFTTNVEQEMKAYYSKMYNKEMEIKDIVEMLVRMKVSDTPHDQDVFACMIHSLLDEYRFFSEYPLSALASTSLLFGALLEKNLIQGTTLTVALNFIWESCNQPQDSHMFKFAVQSLYNFKSRLHEYPIYCKHLLECQSLSSHAKMYQIVKDAANGIPCSGSNVTPLPETGPKYQSITVSDKQVGFVPQEVPDETNSDKLLFHVNNMTSDNLRLDEIKQILTEKHFQWFANYLVCDRAKTEPNNHGLYSTLVRELDNIVFYEYVLNVSLKEVERIIRNFKESSIDRNHLKNLGAWLGRITLASDKPLRRDQIALKFLLVESFDFKSLHLIIPFICKILDQAQYSKIFKTPNPWVLGVIKVLAELYECADLKLNLKFEIEVLLNSFKLKINDITPSTIIRNHNPKPEELAAMFGIHPETVTLANSMSKLAIGAAESTNQPPTQAQQLAIPPQQPQAPQVESNLDTSFSTLMGNTIFTQHANLRRAFQASLSRAVRECAVPILSRVSEAVLTTTEAMISKDFAREADFTKFRNSYQNLAQKLAHSMVICSGRKILSETIEATMLQLLGNDPNEIPLPELSSAIQSNVGLCVDIVDKIAIDNISELIDDRMLKYKVAREQHKDGEPYTEENVSDYALKLPQPLGIKPDGVSPSQYKIYESFGSNTLTIRQELAQQPEVPLTPQLAVAPEEVISVESLFNAITQSCDKAILLLSDVSETQLADLSANHPIMVALTQALTIAQNNVLKYPELLLRAAQYAVNCLFTQTHENPMSTEIYVVMLDKLCEFSPSTAKDVTWWLVHSSDQRKFNAPVIFSLLKVQLVQATKLDSSIGKLISETNNPVVVKFASNLLANVFSSNETRPIALRSEFAFTLEALTNYSPEDTLEEVVQAMAARENLFELLEKTSVSVSNHLYAQMGYIFTEWIKLLTHGEKTTELLNHFIENLLKNEILTDPVHFETFFKAATDISVTVFATEHELRTRTQRETYLAVDTLAMLIVKIILRFSDAEMAIDYLKNILGVITFVMTNDHEDSKGNWNERAYFRFFSSLLSTWNDASITDADATVQFDGLFYPLIGDVFNALQPIILPGFTFAWVSLIAHRMFLPRLLELPNRNGYATAVKLLSALLKFQSNYSKDSNNDVINVVFKAVNRIFVSLSLDYPDFLVECHYQLITAIPPGYVQLKNIVLSATPAHVIVPDPFTVDLNSELLEGANSAPYVAYKPIDDLSVVGLKKPVENFLRIPAPALMRSIYNATKLNHPKEISYFGMDTINYNDRLINALVLHVGISAVDDKLPNSQIFNPKSSHVALLVDLMNFGSIEFKFHVITAIVNQLRYPNSHTYWFIDTILHLFSSTSIWATSAERTMIQEMIVRVLLERRVVSKPHPWGLTIAFAELIKNSDYGFFELPFVKNAPLTMKEIFDALAANFKGSSQFTES